MLSILDLDSLYDRYNCGKNFRFPLGNPSSVEIVLCGEDKESDTYIQFTINESGKYNVTSIIGNYPVII